MGDLKIIQTIGPVGKTSGLGYLNFGKTHVQADHPTMLMYNVYQPRPNAG
jgi:hypothetical protein